MVQGDFATKLEYLCKNQQNKLLSKRNSQFNVSIWTAWPYIKTVRGGFYFLLSCFLNKHFVENLIGSFNWERAHNSFCLQQYIFLFSFQIKKQKKKIDLQKFNQKVNFLHNNIKIIQDFLIYTKDTLPLFWCIEGEVHTLTWCEGACTNNLWIFLIMREFSKNIPDQAKIVFFH